MEKDTLDYFMLDGKVCVITGGAGFLGVKHAEAVLDGNGVAVLLDLNQKRIDQVVSDLKEKYKIKHEIKVEGYEVDITNKKALEDVRDKILDNYGSIDILINNAANNPKVEEKDGKNWAYFEDFPENIWDDDLNVGIKGAFFCSQVFGGVMASKKKGVILNISSDLGIIGPDQRIYRKAGLTEEEQSVKPVTYSVVKHALLGLTKYLATYWAKHGIRVNAVCPGGVYNNQDEEFLGKLTNLIPLGRMANHDEYKSAILFLVSDASSYMTGSVVSIDGGRTCW